MRTSRDLTSSSKRRNKCSITLRGYLTNRLLAPHLTDWTRSWTPGLSLIIPYCSHCSQIGKKSSRFPKTEINLCSLSHLKVSAGRVPLMSQSWVTTRWWWIKFQQWRSSLLKSSLREILIGYRALSEKRSWWQILFRSWWSTTRPPTNNTSLRTTCMCISTVVPFCRTSSLRWGPSSSLSCAPRTASGPWTFTNPTSTACS